MSIHKQKKDMQEYQSTHNITICSKDDYDNWKEGKIFYNVSPLYTNMPEFPTPAQVDLYLKNTDIQWAGFDSINAEEVLRNNAIFSYESYINYYCDAHFDEFCETYTLPDNENVVAFGYYNKEEL